MEELYPAQTLVGELDGLTVTVVAEAGTFPPNTRMELRLVDVQPLTESLTESVETAIASIQAIDVVFLDEAGQEIEPRKPVQVIFQKEGLGRLEVLLFKVEGGDPVQVETDVSAAGELTFETGGPEDYLASDGGEEGETRPAPGGPRTQGPAPEPSEEAPDGTPTEAPEEVQDETPEQAPDAPSDQG